LISKIEQACYKQAEEAGVIHINVPFAEPLYDANAEEIDVHPWLAPVQRWLSQNKSWTTYSAPHQEVLIHEHWDQWRTKRGIIVAGNAGLLWQEECRQNKPWALLLGQIPWAGCY